MAESHLKSYQSQNHSELKHRWANKRTAKAQYTLLIGEIIKWKLASRPGKPSYIITKKYQDSIMALYSFWDSTGNSGQFAEGESGVDFDIGDMGSCPGQHLAGGGTGRPHQKIQNGDICAMGFLSVICTSRQ